MRNGHARPETLLYIALGILIAWLPALPRVAWALFVAVVWLIAPVVRIAMRHSFLLTEAGDFLLAESGDRILLE